MGPDPSEKVKNANADICPTAAPTFIITSPNIRDDLPSVTLTSAIQKRYRLTLVRHHAPPGGRCWAAARSFGSRINRRASHDR
jgi:hypothetical protein